MVELFEDRARIRGDLGSVLESITTEPADGGALRVRGSMRFGASLVGPKGRLHGGLHAFARTLVVLDALGERGLHESAATYPVRLELGLYRPLPLDESVSFEATYGRSNAGYRLAVDHAERGKLHSIAAPARDLDSGLSWFAAAYARSRATEPIYTLRAQGDIPMSVYDDLVVMPLDRAMRAGGSPTFARFVRDDGSLDAAAICVALDLLGAVTQGYAWQSRIFTARIDLVLAVDSIPGDLDVIALADRAGRFDPEALVRPAPIPGGEAGPTKVRVALVDETFDRAYAYGTFTLVPAPGEIRPRT